jgi:hypothetical protein
MQTVWSFETKISNDIYSEKLNQFFRWIYETIFYILFPEKEKMKMKTYIFK